MSDGSGRRGNLSSGRCRWAGQGGLTGGVQRGRVWAKNDQPELMEIKLESEQVRCAGSVNAQTGGVVLVDNITMCGTDPFLHARRCKEDCRPS